MLWVKKHTVLTIILLSVLMSTQCGQAVELTLYVFCPGGKLNNMSGKNEEISIRGVHRLLKEERQLAYYLSSS